MTTESIIENSEKYAKSKYYDIPLTCPKKLDYPRAQKINFSAIEDASKHFYNKQLEEIEEWYQKNPYWRKKQAMKGLLFGFFLLIISLNCIEKGFCIVVFLMSFFFFVVVTFYALKALIMKQKPPYSMQELELMIYKNYLHITGLIDLGPDLKYNSLGYVYSGVEDNSSDVINTLVDNAYKMKADALIGMDLGHRTSTDVQSKFNGIGGQRRISSDTSHHFNGQVSA